MVCNLPQMLRPFFCSLTAAVVIFAAAGCGGGEPEPAGCVVGTSVACACTNGKSGAQVCAAEHTFGACICAGAGGADRDAAEPREAAADREVDAPFDRGVVGAPDVDGAAGGYPDTGTLPPDSSPEVLDAGSDAGADATIASADADAATTPGDTDASAEADAATKPDSSSGALDASGGDADAPAHDADGSCVRLDPEWCDGKDNDCNGEIDNGEVCPDTTVANVDPFTDGVYLLGTTTEGLCGRDALQRFWPTLATTYYSGFDCYADTYAFRRTDDTVFYTATFSGLYRDVVGGPDVLIKTPPCGAQVDSYYSNPTFGFDAAGTVYYQCSDTVRRGNGELVAQSIQRLVAVLGDGRTIVTRASLAAGYGLSDFVVLDANGAEIARLDPRATFAGELTPQGATMVSGNRAYVSFNRTYGQQDREIVAYRLNEQSAWERMRRVPVTGFGSWSLVISDGTAFIREPDPTSLSEERIRALLPTGEDRIVWREADQKTVRAHGHDQLLVGPP
jgi:hypothetical protein